MEDSATCCSRSILKLKCVKTKSFFGVGFKNAPVCTFKTSPCMPSTRAHLEKHVRVVPVHTGTFLMHTESFSVPHHTRHTPPTPHALPHAIQINITHNTTRRQRQGKREKRRRKRRDKARQGKTKEDRTRRKRRRQDKRREKIHFQCGGAWPFTVDGVLCLVNPVND